MRTVKTRNTLKIALVALAILFSFFFALPKADAAPTLPASSYSTVVGTDAASDAKNKIKGDPKAGAKDIELANEYLPVLRWNGIAGTYHSRYSSQAWDRADAEASGLSTMARSILQFGDALWSFTATTVNLSSSVDVFSTIGAKIDTVLSSIGKALFNGGGKAGTASVVTLIMAANVIYAFSKARRQGGFAPLKELLGKVAVTGFIAFLVFGAASGASPSEKVVGGVVKVVDAVGTTFANTADDALVAANNNMLKENEKKQSKAIALRKIQNGDAASDYKNVLRNDEGGQCKEYVKALHDQYRTPTRPGSSGNSSVIIDSLSKMWESSALPMWQRIQFRTTPTNSSPLNISNTWCHTAESLMNKSPQEQGKILSLASTSPDTTGRKGWYGFASGVSGGSVNRDQAIMFWTACQNQGTKWKLVDPTLIKGEDKKDEVCQKFWDGSQADANLDPSKDTPYKFVKKAMNDAWSETITHARNDTDGQVIRGAKSFDDWCTDGTKRTQANTGDNLEREAKLQARWMYHFLKNLGFKNLYTLAEGAQELNMNNVRNFSGGFTSEEISSMSKQYAEILKKKYPEVNEEETKNNFYEALNRVYKGTGWSLQTSQAPFCEMRALNPDSGSEATSSSLTTSNPNGAPFDWSPSDASALAQLANKGGGESTFAFISSAQNPTWGAGLFGIAVLYLMSSAVTFLIFTAMGVSILIAKTALMLMMLSLGLMLFPAIIPGVRTGEKFKKVFITLIGFAGVASVMMLAVSVTTIISKVMVDTGTSLLPQNSSFSVLWAGIAPGATIIGLNILLKKIGMPSPLSVKGALSWGANGSSMLKGAMAGAAAARAASRGRSLASRAGASIGRGRRNDKRAKAMQDRQKGSDNANPKPLPAKNSQAAWNKKSAVGRGVTRAKTNARNRIVGKYNNWVQNSSLGKKVSWANGVFAQEWAATKGQRGIWRLGASAKAWSGSMRASRGGTGAQVRHMSNLAAARKAKQTMPKTLSVVNPTRPQVLPGGSGTNAPTLAPSNPPASKPSPKPGSGSGSGSSTKPGSGPTPKTYRSSTPSKHPGSAKPKHP